MIGPARNLDKYKTAYINSGREMPPRLRNAIRLYESGATRTMADAARVAGISANNFSGVRKYNPMARAEVDRIRADINTGVVDMSSAIARLGRLGVGKIAELMETAAKEEIQLKAAQDLADSSHETSKTHKVALEGDVTLPASTVNDLARALIEQAARREKFADAASGDYIKVNEAQPLLALPQENK
jgi:hypothetical protein